MLCFYFDLPFPHEVCSPRPHKGWRHFASTSDKKSTPMHVHVLGGALGQTGWYLYFKFLFRRTIAMKFPQFQPQPQMNNAES